MANLVEQYLKQRISARHNSKVISRNFRARDMVLRKADADTSASRDGLLGYQRDPKTMAPRLHGTKEPELLGYLDVSRKVKLSEVLGNVVPWLQRSRF
ncbi:hypothetical protein PIB30_091776 [Stylosanthes scabra]|uniref:Uncharacterized protein n=1 Tax=Stylosanthes scabra TaxID=79078 RepID=A0ABU6VV04_9FABA|nr:hypothetical protein [Stylosanthes scabra]